MGKRWHVGARHHVRALQGVGRDASRRAVPPAVLQVGGRGGGRRNYARDAERNTRGGDADEVGSFPILKFPFYLFRFQFACFRFLFLNALFVPHTVVWDGRWRGFAGKSTGNEE